MARSKVVLLHERTPRVPRLTAAILTESHMEAAEAARRLLVFMEHELLTSFQSGDLGRLRLLQSAHRDATTILVEHRKQSAWADSQACADGRMEPGHGVAA